MSFGGPGVGGSSEMLAYMIKAFDDATPVFRAFGRNVDAVTKSVQTAVVEMNKAMAASGKGVVDMAGREEAAMSKVGASARQAAASAGTAAREQEAASKQSMAAAERQAAATQRSAAVQKRSAAESAVAFGTAGSAATKMGRDILIATGTAGAAFLDLQGKFQANTLRMQTQAGATAHGLDQIRKGLLAMAGQVGATPDQLANGMYHVVSAMNAVLPPATRVRQELQIMKIAAEGAQVGHANLEETTYALTSALNALHKTAKDAGTVMGQLNAIVGSGDMTMADLLDAFKSGLIPAADSFHISLQSVGAALSVMGDMGMRGALAGTRLRMALSLLAAPTDQAAGILRTLGLTSKDALSTSEAMSKALAKAGVNTTQLSADLRKPDGLQVALSDLNKHLMASGLSSEAAGAAISRAFGGGRMGAAVTLMAENTDRLKLKFDQIGDTGRNFGKAWQLTSQTFRVELDKAVASIEAFGVKVGEWLLPYAGKALKDIEDLTNWFSKNEEALRLLGGTVITFASVAIGSYFISKVTKAINLMKSFGTGLTGMGRWMLGIGSTPSGATGPLGAATSPVTGGAASGSMGGGGAMLTNVVGFSTRPALAGSKMNPIAVVIASAGLSTGAASSTEARAEKAAGIGPAAKIPAPGETVAPTPVFGTSREARYAAQAEIAASMPGAAAAAELAAAEQAQAAALDAQTIKYDAGTSLLNKDTLALRADTQLAARAMGQVAQELDLFQGEILKMEESLAIQGEQLTLGGIATPLGAKGTFKELTAEEQLAASQAGPGFWSKFGSKTQAAAGAVGSAAQDAAKFGRTVGSTAMRAGVMGGTIFLGSQLAGQMIPGQTGRTVSHIGTATAVGATAGTLATLIPGVGPMVGPLVGALSGAIIGGLAEAIKKPDWGKKLADNLPKGFGGAQRSQLQSTVASDTNAMAKLTESLKTTTGLVPHQTGKAGVTETRQSVVVPIHVDFSKLNVDQQAQYLRLAHDAGSKLAKKMDEGMGQYKFQSEPVMLEQFKGVFGKMPPAIQAVGAEAAIKFAKGLESQGRLPKGSAETLLAGIKNQFPEFVKFMGLQGEMSIQQFTKALDFSHAQDATHKALNHVQNDFASVEDVVSKTTGTVNDKVAAAIPVLKSIASSGTGPMRKQAEADIKALRHSVSNDFTAMGALVDSKAKDMASSIKGGSASSAQTAEANFSKFVASVQKAMAAGDLATGAGMKIIADTTNSVIKALGGTPIPVPQLITHEKIMQGIGAGTVNPNQAFHATGGKVTSPSYVVGEEAPLHPEYILSTNPAYRPRNAKLWAAAARDMGIPGFAQGGYIDPIPGFHLGRTDMGVDARGVPGMAILAMGPSKMTALVSNWYQGQPLMDFQLTGGPDKGRYWYVAEQIVPAAHVGQTIPQGGVVARYASHGTGIEIGWAANASGQTLAKATTGYHEGQVTPAGQSFMSIIGGAGGAALPGMAIPSIHAPKVSGKGIIANIVRASLNQVTGAANAYISAQLGGLPGGLPSAGGGNAMANKALAKHMMPSFGWNVAQQFPYLDALWTQESGWNQYALNPTSHALGIPQALPGSKMASAGPDWQTNPATQEKWGMGYIKSTYHDPQGAEAHERKFNWYKIGGRRPAFAGMFGDGGMFTANGPTMAMFGERGPEDVMAVPHFQTGGIFTSADVPLGSPQWSPAPADQVHVPPPADTSKPSKPPVKRYHYDPLTGQIVYVTAEEWNKIAANIAYVRGHEPAKIHQKHQETPKPWYDPALGKIIEVTPSERSQLVADNAQSRAKTSAANKAHQKWLSEGVTDVLSAGGVPTGILDMTRRQAIAGHLPMGGTLDLINKDLVKLTETAWNKVSAALKRGVADLSEGQVMKVAGTLSRHSGARDSRQAKAANIAIAAGLKDVTSDFSAQQAGFQRSDSIAQLLAGLAPGTPLSKLGLSKAQLHGIGLTRKTAKELIGGGPSAFAEQVDQLQKNVIPGYSQDAAHLQTLYKDALKTHNKKLQNSLKKQLDEVTQAQVQAYADLQAAQVNQVEAIYNKAQDKINKAQGGVDLIKAFQGLPGGTTADSLGLSDAVISALGLGRVNLGSVAGGADPMAAYANTSRLLASERSTMVNTLNQLVSKLPTLSGSALDQANQHILDLSKSIASVSQEMNTDLMDAIKATAQAFQSQADAAGGRVTALSAIANLPTGTNLSALGLTPNVLSQVGITPETAAAIMGGGPAAISAEQQAQNGQLTPGQIVAGTAYYNAANAGITKEIGTAGTQHEFWNLGAGPEHPAHWQMMGNPGTGLAGELSYEEALLPTASSRQQYDDIVTSITGLVTTIAGLGSTMSDNTDAIKKLTNATTAKAFQDQADAAGGRVTALASIANLSTGTNLSALGLTPAVLASIGIDSATAASVLGGGPSAISAEQQAQGGQLTPDQIAAAKNYYTTANAGITSEIGTAGTSGNAGTGLLGELSYDEAILPTLTGQEHTDMITTITNLITTIAGLGSTMSDNTDAMKKLTGATNANTSATGQMTGTVAYSYNGESGYTATLSSNDGTNLGVGG